MRRILLWRPIHAEHMDRHVLRRAQQRRLDACRQKWASATIPPVHRCMSSLLDKQMPCCQRANSPLHTMLLRKDCYESTHQLD